VNAYPQGTVTEAYNPSPARIPDEYVSSILSSCGAIRSSVSVVGMLIDTDLLTKTSDVRWVAPFVRRAVTVTVVRPCGSG